jgi:uncharacterized protein
MKTRIPLVSTLILACIAGCQGPEPAGTQGKGVAPAASVASGQVSREKEREIRKLLEITGTTKAMPQMMDQMMAEFRKALPNVPPEFFDDFRKEINFDELVSLIVPVYDKHLSLEDIKAANAFFATPAGKHFAEKMSVMSTEGFEVGRQWGESKGRLVADRLKEKGLDK